MRVWLADTGREFTYSLTHDGPVRDLCFSPDGTRLATASADGRARIWDVATGRTATDPFVHGAGVTALAFSPDGRWLATASSDGMARVWGVDEGLCVLPPLARCAPVRCVAFRPDGRALLTASSDTASPSTRRGSGTWRAASRWVCPQAWRRHPLGGLQPGRPEDRHGERGSDGPGLGRGHRRAADAAPRPSTSGPDGRVQPGRSAAGHVQPGRDRAGLGRRDRRAALAAPGAPRSHPGRFGGLSARRPRSPDCRDGRDGPDLALRATTALRTCWSCTRRSSPAGGSTRPAARSPWAPRSCRRPGIASASRTPPAGRPPWRSRLAWHRREAHRLELGARARPPPGTSSGCSRWIPTTRRWPHAWPRRTRWPPGRSPRATRLSGRRRLLRPRNSGVADVIVADGEVFGVSELPPALVEQGKTAGTVQVTIPAVSIPPSRGRDAAAHRAASLR